MIGPDIENQNPFNERYDGEIECPWCESGNTHVISPFGGTVSEVSMQCDDCKSTFGWMKWQGKLPDSE
jgi:C4-type Zn-finger protein